MSSSAFVRSQLTRGAQTQSYRIFKHIAAAYAMKLIGNWLNERVSAFTNMIASGVDVPEDITELHATTAGLKGLCSFLCADGIEDLRKVRCRDHPSLQRESFLWRAGVRWTRIPSRVRNCEPGGGLRLAGARAGG